MDAETAYHLGRIYKERANGIPKDLRFWGEHLPPSHVQRLESIRSTYEVMKSEMRRVVESHMSEDPYQIKIYLALIDEQE